MSENNTNTGPSASVKSADRVLAILDLFALRQKALTLTEISSELGYPMSSVLALMKSLSASGYIQLDPDTKSYVPTLRVAMLGTWIMGNLFRSEERRVGKACFSTCRSGWSPYR